jgi:hypothetical protein
MGGRWQIGSAGGAASVAVAALLVAGAAGCGSDGHDQGSPQGTVGSGGRSGDASTPTASTACGAPAATGDLCSAVSIGTITACSHDAGGQPSQTGYLEIRAADGTRTYTCAASWSTGGSGGYWFDHPEQFMSDPQSCCGAAATPVSAPSAPQPAIGYLGALHAPRDIKPQESAQPGAGLLRQNPFAVTVADASGLAAFQSALATWHAWAGDGQAHEAPDGSGAYTLAEFAPINYAILETRDGQPVVVIGPEVSVTADGKSPLGHPTLGACPAGGGAPLVLMAGELAGTTLTNHSGRYGHDSSVTPEALDTASKLFNCLGISVTATTYFPPKP